MKYAEERIEQHRCSGNSPQISSKVITEHQVFQVTYITLLNCLTIDIDDKYELRRALDFELLVPVLKFVLLVFQSKMVAFKMIFSIRFLQLVDELHSFPCVVLSYQVKMTHYL